MSESKITDRQMILTDEEGKEQVFTILFTFHSDAFDKDYVIFYSTDQEGDEEIELNAASYIEGPNGIGELESIETDEEWEMIENALDHYVEEYDDDEEEECDDEDCEHCCHHDHEDDEE